MCYIYIINNIFNIIYISLSDQYKVYGHVNVFPSRIPVFNHALNVCGYKKTRVKLAGI